MGVDEIKARLRVKTAGVGASALNFASSAVKNDPAAAVLTGGMAALMVPQAYQDYTSPEAKANRQAETAKRRNLAADVGRSYLQAHTKTSSVQFDIKSVRRAKAIGDILEKKAAGGMSAAAALADPINMYAAGLLLGAGVATSGAAALAASKGVGKITELAHTAGRTKRYEDMLRADPALKKFPQARTYFDVIDKASPYVTSEPHVAAATVRSMLESPEGYALHPKMVKDILGVEGERQSTRFPELRAPVFKGALPGAGEDKD
jgi:hypothetical protein